VLGGDFNSAAGDAVFRLLRPRLSDSFAVAGRGWGATFSNELPTLRIDQLWISQQLRAIAVSAHPTQFSDHRMVVADISPVDGRP
jgi:endonuclease/exonuclease/phosphatase (EEP) superfamily protein YafD